MRATIPISTPIVGLSGTLTTQALKTLPSQLGMTDPLVISANPDRPNIVLNRIRKAKSNSVYGIYEDIFVPEIHKLHESPEDYPVTLMYMPLQWAATACAYCQHIFGPVTLDSCRYASVFSTQSKEVLQVVTGELKKPVPRIRLVFCTSAIGMGFDSGSITRVIHAKPPRNLSDYFQEISRAGRAGQPAHAFLHFSASDIAANIKGMTSEVVEYCKTDGCLRTSILSTYGFNKNQSSPVGCQCCSVCKETCNCNSCLAGLLDEPMDEPMEIF